MSRGLATLEQSDPNRCLLYTLLSRLRDLCGGGMERLCEPEVFEDLKERTFFLYNRVDAFISFQIL